MIEVLFIGPPSGRGRALSKMSSTLGCTPKHVCLSACLPVCLSACLPAVQMEVIKTFEPPEADRDVSPLLMAFIRKVGRAVNGEALSCQAEGAGSDG